MKKLLFAAAATSLLFAASCKKKDDNNNSIGSWTVKGTTYNATGTDSTMNGNFYTLYANDASVNQIDFNFNNNPVTGTYKVVSAAALGSATGNAVAIESLINSAATTYSTTGNDNVNASVTVSNGKVTITVPSVSVKNLNNSSDSTTLTATIAQQ